MNSMKFFFVLAVMLSVPVLAAHTSSVSSDPQMVGGSREANFLFNATNGGKDSINEFRVRIPSEFSALKCGTAPQGWTLAYSDAVECNYKTVSNYITADNSAAFSLNVTTAGKDGNYTWEARTKDVFDGFSLHNPVTALDGTAPAVLATTLTAPNGGEKWEAGTSHDILWAAKDVADGNLADKPILIEYSSDAKAWNAIAANQENSGTYAWNIPADAAAGAVRVRLTAYDSVGNAASDESDAPFAITPSVPAVTVKVGESKAIDANKDGKDDATITVKGVTADSAVLVITVPSVAPAATPKATAATTAAATPVPGAQDKGVLSNPTVTAIVVILILIILYLIWRLQQTEKKKK